MPAVKAWGWWVVRHDEWFVWYMWGAGGGVEIAGCDGCEGGSGLVRWVPNGVSGVGRGGVAFEGRKQRLAAEEWFVCVVSKGF